MVPIKMGIGGCYTMPAMKPDNDYIIQSENDLHARQCVLVRAFLANCALIVLAGVIMITFDCGDAMAAFLGGPRTAAAPYMTRGLLAWGIGGVVIFLVPALATYWARCGLDK